MKKIKLNKEFEIFAEAILMILLIISMPIVFSKLTTISEKGIYNEDIFDSISEKTINFLDIIPTARAESLFGCCLGNDDSCSLRSKTECSNIFKINYQWFDGKFCDEISQCQKGCCAKYGECAKNTGRAECQAAGGDFYEGKTNCEDVSACSKTCCKLSGATAYITEQQCDKINGESVGVDGNSDFEKEINCALESATYPLGCCISNNQCTFTNKYDCDGNFQQNHFCNEFKTQCPGIIQHSNKICSNGEIYFTDNYNNLETLAENCTRDNKLCTVDSTNNGKPYCKTSSCSAILPSGKSVSVQNYGKICVYDQQLDPYNKDPNIISSSAMGEFGIDVVGSEHWIWTCINGKFYPEMCGSGGRTGVCIEERSQDAKCVPNTAANCFTATTKQQCYSPNTLGLCYWLPDMMTKEGIPINIANLPGFKGDLNLLCLPKYSLGSSQNSVDLVAKAASTAVTVNEKKSETGSDWNCDGDNCDSSNGIGAIDWDGDKELKGDYSETSSKVEAYWAYALAKRCSSIGDYGIKSNLYGVVENGVEFRSKCIIADGEDFPGDCEGDRENYAYWVYGESDPYYGASWGEAGEMIGSKDGLGQKLKNDLINEQNQIKIYNLDSKNGNTLQELAQKFNLGITGNLIWITGFVSVPGYPMGVSTPGQVTPLIESGGTTVTNSIIAAIGNVAVAAGIGVAAGLLVAGVIKLFGGSTGDAKQLGLLAGTAVSTGILIATGVISGTLPIIGAIAAILIQTVLFFLGEDQRAMTYEFSCLPYTQPYGGTKCEDCNKDPTRPCNEYRCLSLGADCGFKSVSGVVGTDGEFPDGFCFAYSPGDNSPPAIKSVSAEGYTIKEQDYNYVNGHVYFDTYLNYYNPDGIKIKLTTDERALCRWSILPNENPDFETLPASQVFQDININKFLTTHERTFVPASIGLVKGDNLTIKVLCVDTNGNEATSTNVFKIVVPVSVEDVVPPRITEMYPRNGGGKNNESTSANVKIYLNEKVKQCKWGYSDEEYNVMPNLISNCNNIENSQLYCNVTLPFNGQQEDNKYYFRCEDMKGNINNYGYEYILHPVGKLNITEISPSGNIESCSSLWNVTLNVKTSEGSEDGISKCVYEDAKKPGIFELFETTNSNEHSQELSLGYGNYNYNVICKDLDDNIAQAKISFNINLNINPPEITRIYKDGDSLAIQTSKNAKCFANENTDGCHFSFNEGILDVNEMSTDNYLLHTLAWRTEPYYIKCQDLCGNGATINDQCTTIYPEEI